MSVRDGSSVSQWLQCGMREAGGVQPLGEPSCPSCGTGNSHLHVQEQDLSVPWRVWGSPSTAAPLQHPSASMELPWSTPRSPAGKPLPGGQEITSVLVWHPGAQFIQRERHGFVSSFKGKTPSQVILAPCASRVVSLLCTIPSSPCCSLKCIPGKTPSAPRIWKSDTLQTHGGGLRFGSFFSCCARLFRWPPLEPAHGMGVEGWILGGNGEVGWSNPHFTMWVKIKPPPQDDVCHGGFAADHNQAT